jgi:hypothetical protein
MGTWTTIDGVEMLFPSIVTCFEGCSSWFSPGKQNHTLFSTWVQTRVNKLVPGTGVMILKIFSPKNLAQNWRFLNSK